MRDAERARQVGITLHLAQRDRRFGEAAVGVETASPESFQPWLTRPLSRRRRYSRKPSPSASP